MGERPMTRRWAVPLLVFAAALVVALTTDNPDVDGDGVNLTVPTGVDGIRSTLRKTSEATPVDPMKSGSPAEHRGGKKSKMFWTTFVRIEVSSIRMLRFQKTRENPSLL